MSEPQNDPKSDGSSANSTETTQDSDSTNQAKKHADAVVAVAVKAIREAETTAKIAAEAEQVAREAIAKAESAKAAAEVAAEAEYKAIADEVKAEKTKGQAYTFKRQSEEIFRREMHEPEFFLHKKDRFPVPILSPAQQEELTRKAEIPVDNTPQYVPERVLSPEYGGVSNYESSMQVFLEDAKVLLERLKNDPDASSKDLAEARHNVSYLESLHENYFLGMNVFRTAKGGRSKLSAR